MRKFYDKNGPRFVYEYTNYIYNDIEKNSAMNKNIQCIMDIMNYTIEHLTDIETIYQDTFNNNIVDTVNYSITTTENTYYYMSYNELVNAMISELKTLFF